MADCACRVSLEKKIFVFGGTVDAFSRHASVNCEVYDITLTEWHSIKSMHVPRFHASAVLLRDQIYVFGGTGSESVDRHNSRMVECYDGLVMCRRISGLWDIPCHMRRHILEGAQSACLKTYSLTKQSYNFLAKVQFCKAIIVIYKS